MMQFIFPMRIPKLSKYLNIQNTSRDIVVGASIVLLVAVNILISGVSVRLDLSRGKAYSLSASTQKILASLKDPVEITFFLSDNIPSSFLTTKNQVNDLLVEYRRGSSQVSLSYVDPRKQGQQAAQEYGIQEVQFSQLAQDEYAVSSGYFSIGVQSNGQKIAIQQLDPTNLEYTITSIIYKVSQPEEVTVGLAGIAPSFGGQFGASSPESFNVLQQILGQQFTLANFDGANESVDYKTLVVLDGLSSPLTDEMTEQIDAYVKEGGKIIAFTSGVDIGEDMMAASRESKLAPLVSNFGMQVNTDLVLSNQAEIVNFSNDFFNRGKYPFWLMTNVFNPDASYTANVNYLLFPWTSSLMFTQRDGVVQKDIVRTTPQSWARTAPVSITPESIQEPKASALKSQLLIGYGKDTKTGAELMLIPSVRFVDDNYLGRSGNLEFIVNLVNEFASDGALSGIRSRALTALPLPALDATAKDIYKWANVLALPLLLSAWGAIRLKKRG